MGLPASSIKKVNSVPEIQIESLDKKLEVDAERFVQGLHDFFKDPKSDFEEVTARLEDGADEFVEGLVSVLRGIPRKPVRPDKILNNVLGVVAAARGFSDDQRPRIIRRIIMSLCR
jgi:hypothetical protein